MSLDVEINQMVNRRKSSIAMGKDDLPKDEDDQQSSDQEAVDGDDKGESSSQMSDQESSDAQQKLLKRRK